MITAAYAQTMAAYNSWQNRNLYGAASKLSDAERKAQRGAFFGSIHATLNHVLWGDRMWMSRFAGTPAPKVGIPQSVALYEDWAELARERVAFDETIVDWCGRLDDAWLAGSLTYYSAAAARELSKPRGMLVAHFFNHQTHHRGQVHCMLTQCGARPGDTDLPFMPA